MPKSIDEPKLYGKYTKVELLEMLDKVGKSCNETRELLKQVKDALERDQKLYCCLHCFFRGFGNITNT
jgi:hypothetical protein